MRGSSIKYIQQDLDHEKVSVGSIRVNGLQSVQHARGGQAERRWTNFVS